ncbi:MAG: sugar transferase [Mesorhizobium sp.]|nr:sugar transferase [Mesorhizobium sp.]
MVDVVLASAGICLAAPLIAFAALAVRLTSRGPAIFVQTRVGRHEMPFRCLKLRTMWSDTGSVPTHEAPGSAITPVGRVLRRAKIDELPQLWNVLVGEMSMVGPRPCLPTQSALIEARRRGDVFSVRPGITGLAQVRGIDMSIPALCAASDSEYVAKAGLRCDLHIIAATVLPGITPP